MPLASLPNELQLRIMHFHDTSSYIRLTMTSRHFLSLREDQVMKEALLEYEKKFKYPSKLLYEPCLPCYGCLKRVLLENLAMVHSRALYGGDPWDNVYENYNEDEFPFALGGELAEKRRCKACDKKSGGAFSRYAKGVRADILREEAEELADVRRELGGGF